MSHFEEGRFGKWSELPRDKKWKYGLLLAFLVIDLLLVIVVFLMPWVEYGNANKNVRKGNYEKAMWQYNDLGDYKEALQRLEVARGLCALKEGKTAPAIAYIVEQGMAVEVVFDPGEGKMAQNIPDNTVRYQGNNAPSAEVPLPEAEKAGYQFQEWSLEELSYKPGKNDTVHVKLQALFTTIKYAIHYEGGEGMENPNPAEYNCEGATITLQAPTWKGYEFLGWTWEGQDTPTMTAKIPEGSKGEKTFVTHWEGLTYEVTLDPNGGTVSPKVKTVTMGKPANLPTPYLKGYAFQGWSQGGLLIQSNGAWCVSENTSAKAMWKAKNYTITLDADGGVCSSKSVAVTYDAGYSLPTPTREGYDFQGWYNGTTKYSGGTWKTDSNLTLKAVWKGKQFTVTLNPGDGTISKKTVTVTMGEGYSFTAPVRSGYKFTGWVDASGKSVSSSGTWNTAANVTLTAQWEMAKYTLTIDPNGGVYSGSTKTLSVDYGKDVTLENVSKQNNEFLGWYIDGTKVNNPFKYTYETDKVVMAHWKENPQPPASGTNIPE